MLRDQRSPLRTLACLVTILAGCGSDSSGPSHANVTGVWTLNAANLAAPGLSCSISGARLVLNQSGTSFTGSYSAATVACAGIPLDDLSGTIVNGTVNLQQITFDMDTQDNRFSGTVNGASMSGTASLVGAIEDGGSFTPVTFTGSWSASRQ